jgi:hypothetical protein
MTHSRMRELTSLIPTSSREAEFPREPDASLELSSQPIGLTRLRFRRMIGLAGERVSAAAR